MKPRLHRKTLSMAGMNSNANLIDPCITSACAPRIPLVVNDPDIDSHKAA
ncbi:MAG: hypothetical protein ACE5FH_02805 [Candidatus Zixiibacteriota bacterium]